MRFLKVFVFLAVIVFSVVGCGGSGGHDANFWQGSYRATFYRGALPGDTTLVLTIDSRGNAHVMFYDDVSNLTHKGTGHLTEAGDLDMVAVGGSDSITIDGTADPAGHINISLSGAANNGITVFSFENSGAFPFGSRYDGTFSGSSAGSFTLLIAANGAITGTVTVGETPTNITGMVDQFGQVEFTGGSLTFSGHLYLSIFGSFGGKGTFNDGTWNAHKTG